MKKAFPYKPMFIHNFKKRGMKRKVNLKTMILNLIVLVLIILAVSCNKQPVVSPLEWGMKMSDSDMKRNPDPAKLDFVATPEWSYTQGLVGLADQRLTEATGEKRFADYALKYANDMIDDSGEIATYDMERFNLDMINSGKILFQIYKETGNEKYRKAIFTLRDQLRHHPRTPEGGFWHKKVYTQQMWLDGIYMAAPFYAQFGKEFNEPEVFGDVFLQISLIQEYTFDEATGLNVHGWDSSHSQKWANPETGKSPHVWGRAEGWYMMALVDVLDFIPKDYKHRSEIEKIFKQIAKGVVAAQDKESRVWYQVMDEPGREGNYLEATCSGMFVYALLKGARMGYLDASYMEAGKTGFDGIIKNFIRENEDGTISLTQCCAVAGLGGNPYRDGSFKYYTTTKIRDNDPKGVGPFIMACVERSMEK